MKKTLFFIASLALLVSCTKTVEINSEKSSMAEELTLSTIANPTKAIAEGTTVPTDNEIRFFPRFYSDISSFDYSSSNKICQFGYSPEDGVWRNFTNDSYSPIAENKMERTRRGYNFTPFYWPAGERVFMDYVACAFSNYLASKTLVPVSVNPEEAVTPEKVMEVGPVVINPNHMNVDYDYHYLNGPFASSMLLTYNEFNRAYIQFEEMVEYGYVSEEEAQSIKGGLPRNIREKYEEAVKLYLGEIEDIDEYLASEDRCLEGDTEGEVKANASDILNRIYWIYMTQTQRIYKFMQDDLLYAHDRSLRNNNHGAVKATFNHAKAWIKVIINNQTQNDLYVSGIWFNNVKSGGTLIIDNSKSEFEAYWDFPAETSSVGTTITPYTEVNLDAPAVIINPGEYVQPLQAQSTYPSQGANAASLDGENVPGMLPDQYLVPSGCYGPALAIDKYPDTGLAEALKFTFLNGNQSFDLGKDDCKAMVGRLAGMMFPAQEPGKITIKYTFWKKQVTRNATQQAQYIIAPLPMEYAVEMYPTFLPSDTREISLNLPRQAWKMGKVYVYVLTIAEDEITINPTVMDWENADPIFYPSEDEPTEEGNGQTPTFGSNTKPDWWK